MIRLTKTTGRLWAQSLALLFPIVISSTVFADPMYGLFMIVKGDVSFQNPNSPLEKAKVGAKVFEGAQIKSEKDSRAKIVMADRNVFNLSPESKLVIQKYDNTAGKKNVSLSLEEGKVRVNVEQKYDGDKEKFLLKTPTVVAGVRGTQFLGSYNSITKVSQIVTFKGSVAMTSFSAAGKPLGTSRVNKGQSCSVGAGQAPDGAHNVPPQQLRDLDKSTASTNSEGKSGAGPGTATAVKSSNSRDTDTDTVKEIKVAASDVNRDHPGPPNPPPPPKAPPAPPTPPPQTAATTKIIIIVH